MIIENTPRIKIEPLANIHDERECAVFTQDVPWSLVQQEITLERRKVLFVDSPVTEHLLRECASKTPAETKAAYGVGGGAAIDVAKYVASVNNLEMVAIPTILSNDAFLGYETAVRQDGVVAYLKTKQPEVVHLDLDLISKAPRRMNLCGCSDVLSIFTASFDWKYADQLGKTREDERYDPSVHKIATSIMRGIEHHKRDIRACNNVGLKRLLNLLFMETCLNNVYGNARPEEGSEHFFTYAIEKNTRLAFLHGEMVALGILLMSNLQEQDWASMRNLIDYIGIGFRDTGAGKRQIVETLLSLRTFVEEHNYRYTVINDLDLSRNEAENIVDQVLG